MARVNVDELGAMTHRLLAPHRVAIQTAFDTTTSCYGLDVDRLTSVIKPFLMAGSHHDDAPAASPKKKLGGAAARMIATTTTTTTKGGGTNPVRHSLHFTTAGDTELFIKLLFQKADVGGRDEISFLQWDGFLSHCAAQVAASGRRSKLRWRFGCRSNQPPDDELNRAQLSQLSEWGIRAASQQAALRRGGGGDVVDRRAIGSLQHARVGQEGAAGGGRLAAVYSQPLLAQETACFADVLTSQPWPGSAGGLDRSPLASFMSSSSAGAATMAAAAGIESHFHFSTHAIGPCRVNGFVAMPLEPHYIPASMDADTCAQRLFAVSTPVIVAPKPAKHVPGHVLAVASLTLLTPTIGFDSAASLLDLVDAAGASPSRSSYAGGGRVSAAASSIFAGGGGGSKSSAAAMGVVHVVAVATSACCLALFAATGSDLAQRVDEFEQHMDYLTGYQPAVAINDPGGKWRSQPLPAFHASPSLSTESGGGGHQSFPHFKHLLDVKHCAAGQILQLVVISSAVRSLKSAPHSSSAASAVVSDVQGGVPHALFVELQQELQKTTAVEERRLDASSWFADEPPSDSSASMGTDSVRPRPDVAVTAEVVLAAGTVFGSVTLYAAQWRFLDEVMSTLHGIPVLRTAPAAEATTTTRRLPSSWRDGNAPVIGGARAPTTTAAAAWAPTLVTICSVTCHSGPVGRILSLPVLDRALISYGSSDGRMCIISLDNLIVSASGDEPATATTTDINGHTAGGSSDANTPQHKANTAAATDASAVVASRSRMFFRAAELEVLRSAFDINSRAALRIVAAALFDPVGINAAAYDCDTHQIVVCGGSSSAPQVTLPSLNMACTVVLRQAAAQPPPQLLLVPLPHQAGATTTESAGPLQHLHVVKSVDCVGGQCLTLDVKGLIKVWDLRSFVCLQTLEMPLLLTESRKADFTSLIVLSPTSALCSGQPYAQALFADAFKDDQMQRQCDVCDVSAACFLARHDADEWEDGGSSGRQPHASSLEGLSFVTSAAKNLRVWTCASGDLQASFIAATASPIRSVAVSVLLDVVFAGLETGEIAAQSLTTGVIVARLRTLHQAPVTALYVIHAPATDRPPPTTDAATEPSSTTGAAAPPPHGFGFVSASPRGADIL